MKIMPSKLDGVNTLPIKKIAFGVFAVAILGLGSVYILNKDAPPPLKKIDIQKPIATPQPFTSADEKNDQNDPDRTNAPSNSSKGLAKESQTNSDATAPTGTQETASQGSYPKDTTQIMQSLTLMTQSLADLHSKVDAIDKTVKELKDQPGRYRTLERVTPKNRAGIAIPSNKGAFDIVGVDIKSLAIIVNKQTKIIAVGEELPNGAIFQGFDGKNVLTSKGPIRVDGAINQ